MRNVPEPRSGVLKAMIEEREPTKPKEEVKIDRRRGPRAKKAFVVAEEQAEAEAVKSFQEKWAYFDRDKT